ncbi:hypothetical protein AWC38_SpisGene20988 [Stylophora pistillata]|uniref:Uncharacterized protein n=1 Tax=Stylophora pistillata TaxID=50429 RepID=A0A2B4R902_STYPI|nr:hypothetical protein AWC38_SpisGene20988 [Stylophora pistillata]
MALYGKLRVGKCAKAKTRRLNSGCSGVLRSPTPQMCDVKITESQIDTVKQEMCDVKITESQIDTVKQEVCQETEEMDFETGEQFTSENQHSKNSYKLYAKKWKNAQISRDLNQRHGKFLDESSIFLELHGLQSSGKALGKVLGFARDDGKTNTQKRHSIASSYLERAEDMKLSEAWNKGLLSGIDRDDGGGEVQDDDDDDDNNGDDGSNKSPKLEMPKAKDYKYFKSPLFIKNIQEKDEKMRSAVNAQFISHEE